jgi:hypothetical protein
MESLEMRKEMLGSDHADVAETLINLANVTHCCAFACITRSHV